jgi:hypothetical protein
VRIGLVDDVAGGAAVAVAIAKRNVALQVILGRCQCGSLVLAKQTVMRVDVALIATFAYILVLFLGLERGKSIS